MKHREEEAWLLNQIKNAENRLREIRGSKYVSPKAREKEQRALRKRYAAFAAKVKKGYVLKTDLMTFKIVCRASNGDFCLNSLRLSSSNKLLSFFAEDSPYLGEELFNNPDGYKNVPEFKQLIAVLASWQKEHDKIEQTIDAFCKKHNLNFTYPKPLNHAS